MNRTRIFLIVFGSVLVVALLGGMFLYFFEPYEDEVNSGYSLEAIRNPFLASQRFLNKLGVETEVIRGAGKLDDLPPESDVLIASYNHGLENKARREKILDWLNRGGHLILELKARFLRDEETVETPFLKALNVKPVRSNALFTELVNEQVEIKVYNDTEDLTVEFQPQHTLETTLEDPVLYFTDKNGLHLLEFTLGDGTVTVMSDFDMWRNGKIDKFDHAAAFAQIIGSDAGKVWYLYNINMPSLLELLWKNASALVISAGMLLVLMLWHMNNRFGPVMVFQRRQRRSLLEHLDAVGQFDWRYNKAENMLASTRRELHMLIEKHHPQWQKKSMQQQCEWLARRTKISEQDIMQALSGQPENQSGYTRFIRTLQIIRTTI